MSRWNIVVLAGALSASAIAVPPCAGAQTPAPSAAGLATQQARNVSGVSGNAQLTPQGSGTMVTFFGPVPITNPSTSINGAYCSETTRRAATTLPLTNVNGTTTNTLIAIPFSAFGPGHFMDAVRDATSQAQSLQACARF
jgi:hypothetical protein